MSKLEGRVAVVTGGNQGIGKGIARAFAKEGASLVLTARTVEKLESAAEEMRTEGVEAVVAPADVTDESQVESVFAKAMERFGRVDVLVNNAAAFDGGRIDELSASAWDRAMAVNLRGPFLCTRAAFRIMKEQGGGRIINIGSISAQRVRPDSAPYSTSKFGITGLTHATALDGRDYRIVCSCLHPGNTLVERRQESDAPTDDEPMMTVDELAQAAVTMATLPLHVNMLEAIVLPVGQLYVGRG
ncbi:MAG: SDR family NAD(P)-dependent oxidoreductase [Gemmatimonadetes bacterium]|nr:SDR family NAD(P)-dependent oxidoreductase [Gemmatimonadota bacterium]MDE3258003.1 SDR family NAD(P)-dependent oxidoreductase [Gemmatimonadota bacterium]